MRTALGLALLLGSASSVAEPLPLLPYVSTVFAGGSARLSLRQDECYSWGEPIITSQGYQFVVMQSVTAILGCTSGSVRNETILFASNIALGTYRLTYAPMPIGFGPMPGWVEEFQVRSASTGKSLQIEPANPLAMEPIDAYFTIAGGCEWVTGFRIVDNALRVELASDFSSPMNCDGIETAGLTIGAFPPGNYRLELARPVGEGGAVVASNEFVVRPAEAPSAFRQIWPDRSGLWYSPQDDPRTGMSLVHAADPAGRSALTGIWYRYDATGRAVWYIIEASGGTGYSYRGNVYEYAATNPTAPAWQRQVDATPVGTIQISFGSWQDRHTRVDAVVNGQAQVFQIERLRWQRSAWIGIAPP
mgnify:FL=1